MENKLLENEVNENIEADTEVVEDVSPEATAESVTKEVPAVTEDNTEEANQVEESPEKEEAPEKNETEEPETNVDGAVNVPAEEAPQKKEKKVKEKKVTAPAEEAEEENVAGGNALTKFLKSKTWNNISLGLILAAFAIPLALIAYIVITFFL